MAKVSAVNKDFNPYKPNLWAALRDMFLGAVNKGQLLMFLGTVALIILVSRMPSGDIPKILHETLEIFKEMHILGWVLSVLLIITWVVTHRSNTLIFKAEIERLTKEKEELQHILLKSK